MRVAVVEGEDAAPEAMRPAVALLAALEPSIEWVRPVVGQAAMDAHGHPFPDTARELIDSCSAAFFGATSGMSVLALFHLRHGRETFANVRPVRHLPGAMSPLARPDDLDFVIVRENIEDLYLFLEGDLADLDLVEPFSGRPVADRAPGRFAIKAITEAGSERVARHAFALARRRRADGQPGRVTCATKRNVLLQTDGLFAEVAQRVAHEHPDIGYEHVIVDDFARRLVSEGDRLDVVLLPNLYGDILSDAAAGLTGGLGVAPSGCYGTDFAYFEPVHGTAPDIAGQGRINPTATLLSGAMLLEHLGFEDSAGRMIQAVREQYAERASLTPDQGGTASTNACCAEVARRLELGALAY